MTYPGVFPFMNFTIFKQQLIGTLNLAFPFILISLWVPHYAFLWWVMGLYALAIGVYVFYINRTKSNTLKTVLKHEPSEQYKKLFNDEIERCGIKAASIVLRYAYPGDVGAIAMALYNMVIIDPMLWQGVEGDAEFDKVKNILETQVLPGIPEQQKFLQNQIREIISLDVQKFIFKHELGHIVHNYSNKSLAMIGLVGALATITALTTAYMAMSMFGGLAALITGILVGMASDLGFAYLNNFLFKAREEKKADTFAAQYSSRQEIEAAADFFEKHGHHVHAYKKKVGGLSAIVPSVFLTGHPDGAVRASYLRQLVAQLDIAYGS